jgi:GDPmannose 4,6-dehydratase
MGKLALISGITGQDGSYLAEYLVLQGYQVHGLIKPSTSSSQSRIGSLRFGNLLNSENLKLHDCDISDFSRLLAIIESTRPDEIYNLAAQSHVKVSFEVPIYTANVTAIGALNFLEAIKTLNLDSRFYQASSSEMFGSTPPPQDEGTSFYPKSPYATAKSFAYYSTLNYRESYGVYASNGILFNHESPRRGEEFVTRKISKAVAEIKLGTKKFLELGNIHAKRDWGFAPEYVEAMWKIMQHSTPDDFVIATNTSFSVQDFCQFAFSSVDLDWEKYVKFDESLLRPQEVDFLQGDYSKAEKILGWKPTVLAQELAEIMVMSDLQQLKS